MLRYSLTSAQPEKLGAFWRLLPVPVFGGFETVFVFQVRSLLAFLFIFCFTAHAKSVHYSYSIRELQTC